MSRVLDWHNDDPIEDDEDEIDDDDDAISVPSQNRGQRDTSHNASDDDDEDGDDEPATKTPFTMKRFRVEPKAQVRHHQSKRLQTRQKPPSESVSSSLKVSATEIKGAAKEPKPSALSSSSSISSSTFFAESGFSESLNKHASKTKLPTSTPVIVLDDDDDDDDENIRSHGENARYKSESESDNELIVYNMKDSDDEDHSKDPPPSPARSVSPEVEILSSSQDSSARGSSSSKTHLDFFRSRRREPAKMTPENAEDELSESSGPTQNSCSWKCEKCTLKNPPMALACLLCKRERGKDLKNGKWACEHCTAVNARSHEKCFSCANPRAHISDDNNEDLEDDAYPRRRKGMSVDQLLNQGSKSAGTLLKGDHTLKPVCNIKRAQEVSRFSISGSDESEDDDFYENIPQRNCRHQNSEDKTTSQYDKNSKRSRDDEYSVQRSEKKSNDTKKQLMALSESKKSTSSNDIPQISPVRVAASKARTRSTSYVDVSSFGDDIDAPSHLMKISGMSSKTETPRLQRKHSQTQKMNVTSINPVQQDRSCVEDYAEVNLPNLWCEKHRPECFADLVEALPKKRVEEIREWMREVSAINTNPYQTCLVLHGPSGAGKTLCVEVLAKELGIELREWKSETDRATSLVTSEDGLGLDARERHSDFYIPYVSQLDDFVGFLRTTRFPSLQLGSTKVSAKPLRRSILVVEELPYMKSPEKKEAFQRALQAQFRSHHPMIIIYTSHGETANPNTLRRLYSEDVMSAHSTLSLGLGRVPPGRLTRVLTKVRNSENIAVPESVLLDIVLRANGDLRSAIQLLQFYSIGGEPADSEKGLGKRRRKSPVTSFSVHALEKQLKKYGTEQTNSVHQIGSDDGEEQEDARDTVYSINHAVGKLLRAKTLGEIYDEEKSKAKGRHLKPLQSADRSLLSFDPEQVARACPLDGDALCAFVQFNAPQHYTSIDEIAQALDQLSVADVFAGAGERQDAGVWTYEASGRVFPGAYVTSIASRVVAATRTARATLSFADGKVTRPTVFDVQSRRQEQLENWSSLFRSPPVLELSTAVHSELASFQTLMKICSQSAVNNQPLASSMTSATGPHSIAQELGDDEIEDI